MAQFKRKRRMTPKYQKKRRAVRRAKLVTRRDVQKLISKNIETKTSQETSTDGVEIFHNNFVTLTSNLLQTTQGTGDKELGIGDRIGDKVNLRGVSIKLFLELNERYSDVTFRIMVVKSARNDFPSRATLFNGESGNKMMDTINKERYTILAQKYLKIKAPNESVPTPGEAGGVGSGVVYDTTYTNTTLSRATRIVRMWIPGSKFVRSGVLTYEDAVNKPKFFEYSVVCFAYSNYSTLQDVYYVGRVNEFLSKMYYKDA